MATPNPDPEAAAQTGPHDDTRARDTRARRDTDVSRSVARALNILLDVAHAARPQSFSDINKKHRLPKATLHKLLVTLERSKFLRRDPESGKYSIGLATLEISAAADAAPEDLPNLLAPILQQLVSEWNETCHFGVLDGVEDLILRRIDPADQVVRLGPLRSIRNPAHATAGGLAGLATASGAELAAAMPEVLPRSTPNTLASRADLLARLERVRADGFALDLEEAYIGVRCIAVAVAVPRWPIIYVSFSLPLQRASLSRLRELAAPLKRAAREIEEILSVLRASPRSNAGGRRPSAPPD